MPRRTAFLVVWAIALIGGTGMAPNADAQGISGPHLSVAVAPRDVVVDPSAGPIAVTFRLMLECTTGTVYAGDGPHEVRATPLPPPPGVTFEIPEPVWRSGLSRESCMMGNKWLHVMAAEVVLSPDLPVGTLVSLGASFQEGDAAPVEVRWEYQVGPFFDADVRLRSSILQLSPGASSELVIIAKNDGNSAIVAALSLLTVPSLFEATVPDAPVTVPAAETLEIIIPIQAVPKEWYVNGRETIRILIDIRLVDQPGPMTAKDLTAVVQVQGFARPEGADMGSALLPILVTVFLLVAIAGVVIFGMRRHRHWPSRSRLGFASASSFPHAPSGPTAARHAPPPTPRRRHPRSNVLSTTPLYRTQGKNRHLLVTRAPGRSRRPARSCARWRRTTHRRR